MYRTGSVADNTFPTVFMMEGERILWIFNNKLLNKHG